MRIRVVFCTNLKCALKAVQEWRISVNEMITVIIPVYNVKDYLDRCMTSVLEQSYKNLEIILVDDGSTDESSVMCDRYQEKDSRIKVIHKRNGGLSSARNAALDIAQGEFIGFVDSDDYIHKDMFKRMIDAAHRNDSDIVICEHFNEKGDRLFIEDPIYDNEEKMTSQQALEILVDDVKMRSYAWDKLYKAALFEGIRYPEGRNYEDIATTYLLFDKAEKLIRIPEYLYYYQIREGSISNHKSGEKWNRNLHDIIDSRSERYKYFTEKGYTHLAQKDMAQLLPYIYAYIGTCYKFNDYKNVKRMQKYLQENSAQIVENTHISAKDKKIMKMYMSSKAVLTLYNKSKRYIQSVNAFKNRGLNYIRRINGKCSVETDFSLSDKKTRRIIFFELPCFDNLGDHAIAYAQKKFLEDIVNQHKEFQLYVVDGWNTAAIYKLKKVCTRSDIIICQGGGNMGNLYPFADAFRIMITKNFNKNKIVIFPQTVYFTSDDAGKKALKKCQKAYNSCSRLIMCARDSKTYKLMKEYFSAEIIKMNDIVSYLDSSEYASDNREGICLCLRSDIESALNAADKKKIIKLCENTGECIRIADTVTGQELKSDEREQALADKWKLFGRSRLVVTDRLHGMIFSLITKTPCIVLGNNHHKVKQTYLTFKDCDYLYYCDNIDEIPKLIGEVLSRNLPEQKYKLDKKFDKFKDICIK